MTTIKLYDDDAYATEFEAEVLSCEETDRGFKVVLDQTLFFPEEGGQTPDQGTIDGIEVCYVFVNNGIIYHFLDKMVEVGRKVRGIINFSHRFSNMQMHSAEHIFSGYVHKQFGYDNVGFHLSENDATMDYNGKLESNEIKALERLVNEAIWKSVKINTWYPDEDELSKLDYRAKGGIEGPVRMVEIENIDLCACCAPHVRKSSEIGIFKIVKFENYKGGIRIHYLAGRRAYEYLDSLQESINELARRLSSSTDKIVENVIKLQNDNSEYSFEIGKLRRDALSEKISEMFRNDNYVRDDEVCSLELDEQDVDLLRFGIDKLLEFSEKPSLIYSGNDEKGYRFILEGHGESVKDLFESVKSTLTIKGGGKDSSFQGTILAVKEDIKQAFK